MKNIKLKALSFLTCVAVIVNSTAITAFSANTYSAERKSFETNEAIEFVENLGVGWNIGNSLDAAGEMSWVSNELDYESAWCGAKVTKALITKIEKAGFKSIHLPAQLLFILSMPRFHYFHHPYVKPTLIIFTNYS